MVSPLFDTKHTSTPQSRYFVQYPNTFKILSLCTIWKDGYMYSMLAEMKQVTQSA